MLEYCALNPRCSISCFQNFSFKQTSTKSSHTLLVYYHAQGEGLFDNASDTKETYLATKN